MIRRSQALPAVCLLLLLSAAVATAGPYTIPGASGWVTSSPARAALFTYPDSQDGFDSGDGPLYISPTQQWAAASYRVHDEDGWDGPTGFYEYDSRALLRPGETKTWSLYVWALPRSSPQDVNLSWLWTYDISERDPNVTARLEYVQKPSGVTGGPQVGTVWTEPPLWLTLPYYATDDPLTSHAFRFTLTLVPEPSSLAALSFGLVPIAGLALRRRRRG